MEAEAAPLIERLALQPSIGAIPPPAPCAVYSGTYQGATVHVVVNGKCVTHGVDNVGTVPAALTAYLALQAFQPDLVISTGTAGGFESAGAAIGDVFVSTATLNHDRRIPLGVSCDLFVLVSVHFGKMLYLDRIRIIAPILLFLRCTAV